LIPVVFWYIWELQKSDASLQISSHRNLIKFPQSRKVKFRHVPFILRVLSIALIIIALARPQASNSWRTQNAEGIDIMMALDISSTMMIDDVRPNRLEAAKAVASEFILSRPNDNIGLVIFARQSFTQCPMTTDHAVLINLFNEVKSGMIDDGTAIGLGLANAVNRIKESKAKSKVIILLTDGSNNAGDIAPITAAEIAKTFGIRVYTIGVGTTGIVNRPVQTQYGIQYQQVQSEFDAKSLQQIANMTGGKYYNATDNEKLRQIYQDIDKLEKTKISVQQYSKKEEQFYWFALLAFILLVIEVSLRNTIFRKIP
jgi:Ca-activated chloride channel family protein